MVLRAGDVAQELQRRGDAIGGRQMIDELRGELRSGRELADLPRVFGVVRRMNRYGHEEDEREPLHSATIPFLRMSAISRTICMESFPNGCGTLKRISSEK